MTSHHHGSKISGSQQSFFAEMAAAICIVERWKESMGYRFVPKCNDAQESHPRHFFCFVFSDILARPLFADIQKFCYHNNMT